VRGLVVEEMLRNATFLGLWRLIVVLPWNLWTFGRTNVIFARGGVVRLNEQTMSSP
jgi:hypothetical protein